MCLLRNAAQKRSDRAARLAMRTKPRELWMMRVAASRPCQHLLREQGFAPSRDQPFGIQIAGVQSPKSHQVTVISEEREGESNEPQGSRHRNCAGCLEVLFF
jgi:hypothetical protein